MERALSDHGDCVIDFGAGHSVQDDRKLGLRVERALAPVDNVILVLPAADPDSSIKVLNARFSRLLTAEVGQVDPELLRLNEHFVRHQANLQLAKIVIYTENKSPAATCAEIIQKLR